MFAVRAHNLEQRRETNIRTCGSSNSRVESHVQLGRKSILKYSGDDMYGSFRKKATLNQDCYLHARECQESIVSSILLVGETRGAI